MELIHSSRSGGVSLDELLSRSDVVSLHCPLTPKTRHLIDASALRRMKRTAILINTARGPVVDEAALAQALNQGWIAGAGLDVFEAEPEVNPALLRCPNAILLPHLGSATYGTRERMGQMVAADIIAVLHGQTPNHLVSP
jgi:glyoxylate reductase